MSFYKLLSMTIQPENTIETIFQQIQEYILESGFEIVDSDFTRPWGGFFVINEDQTAQFIEAYFPGYSMKELNVSNKLSPKILVVAPAKRLSWQYHYRRSEIWRVLSNEVLVAKNLTDEESVPKTYVEGQIITLQQGERHRLIGSENVGIVAEIWQHTDAENPSNEDDIVRLQDDFAR